MNHRLFVGIRPPEHIRDALLDLMDGVREARWQYDDQLHLTLKFLGDVDRHAANDLAQALGTVRFDPFPLSVEGTGHFERKGRSHTLFAHIPRTPPLLDLRKRIESLCVAEGFEPDHRKYAPHITIARLNASSGTLVPFLARTAELRLGPWTCESYILYESHLRSSGAIYEPVMTYRARSSK